MSHLDAAPRSVTGSGREHDITVQWRVWTGRTAVDCDIIYGPFCELVAGWAVVLGR